MTDKERILAEIERKHNEWKDGNTTEAKYRCEAYKELLEDFDALQEEPVSEDLNKEIQRYMSSVYPDGHVVPKIARHFAQWQKEQILKTMNNAKVK